MKGQHTELRLSFSKAFSGGNAVISPEQGDDFYFTLIGSGTIAKQNAVSESIVTAVNTYPAVTELVEALEVWLAYAEDKLSEFDFEDCLADEETSLCPRCRSNGCINQKIRKARSALSHYRELAGTSNDGAKS